MKANIVKAVMAMSEFFTYNVSPEELTQILKRASNLEDTARDREILRNLSKALDS